MEFKVEDSGDIFRFPDSMDQFATIHGLAPGTPVQVDCAGTTDDPERIKIIILPQGTTVIRCHEREIDKSSSSML